MSKLSSETLEVIAQRGRDRLRDEFAMAAIAESLRVIAQFVMAEPGFKAGTRGLSEVVERGAILAYATADAMLKARK